MDLDAEGERFGALFERDLADPAAIAMAQLKAASAYDKQGIDVPTIVVSGEEDVLARPAFGAALSERIPNSAFYEIRGAAHGAPITHPEQVNRLLDAHISKATARSSAVHDRAGRGSALS